MAYAYRCLGSSMPFGEFAVPVVKDGMVYNGTYALNEQDGTVLCRIAIDTPWLSLHSLVTTQST